MRFCVVLVLLCSSLLFSFPAQSAGSFTVTENASLDFGAVAVPSSGSRTITISSGGLVSGSGEVIYGTPQNGTYTITPTGWPAFPSTFMVSIQIENVQAGAGYTVSAFKGNFAGTTINSFPANVSMSSTASATLTLGATATYNSSVGIGPITPSFDIVVSQTAIDPP